jgi:hypothetical protein
MDQPREQQQLEELLDYCLGFADRMLSDFGEFLPFGATGLADGSVVAVGFWDGREQAPAAELYEMGRAGLAAQAEEGRIIAAAVAADVNVPPQFSPPWPDGVRVAIETASASTLFYRPYRIVKTGLLRRTKSVEYADMIAVEVPHQIFSSARD